MKSEDIRECAHNVLDSILRHASDAKQESGELAVLLTLTGMRWANRDNSNLESYMKAMTVLHDIGQSIANGQGMYTEEEE